MTNDKDTRQAQTHELKADPIPFTEVWEGRKGAEVRRDDRGYQVGDTLRLRETTEDRSSYTGRELQRTITHIQRGYGLPDGIVVLSLFATTQGGSVMGEMTTNGDRQFTMNGRHFVYAGNGFISDQNFDFDASLRVNGDFVGDDKDNYCRMIVAALNAAPVTAPQYPACKGKNCACTDGVDHSSECRAEHDAIAGGPDASWTDLLAYVLQDDLHNRLTPRVIDIAYTAFMSGAVGKTKGGPNDWMNDTKPRILEAIEKLRKDLFADRAAQVQADAVAVDYRKRFEAMVYMLGEITQALGISDDDAACANGNDLILAAIAELRHPSHAGESSQAARDVLAERKRQVKTEFRSPERDDSYRNNELPRAAAAYILGIVSKVFDRGLWPWNMKWWNPTTPRRDLVKAAALILAEIERIDRTATHATTPEGEKK